jgi:hypothetical protein
MIFIKWHNFTWLFLYRIWTKKEFVYDSHKFWPLPIFKLIIILFFLQSSSSSFINLIFFILLYLNDSSSMIIKYSTIKFHNSSITINSNQFLVFMFCCSQMDKHCFSIKMIDNLENLIFFSTDMINYNC